MFLPATFAVALLMTIGSTLCWGSFANTLKLTPGFRFELYYWGYAVGIVLVSLLLAFTLGSFGSGGPAFLDNLRATSAANVGEALLAGFIFNVANVLLIAGIGMVGLAVAYPVSIGIALVEGVALSYAIQPKGNAALLGAGVATALLAVWLIGQAYGSLRRGGKVSRKGIWLCVLAGVLMGLFAPLVTRVMTRAPALTPYTVAVLFTLGAFACCFVFNTWLMRHPLQGAPVSWADLAAAPRSYHALALLGGAVWGLGTVLNFVAAGLVGVAISYAIGQASPMVAAVWGVFVWHEFHGASGRARGYLAGMFACYLLALVLIARAYGG